MRGTEAWNEAVGGLLFLFKICSAEAARDPPAGLLGGARGQDARDSPPRPAPARAAGRTCHSPRSPARREGVGVGAPPS
jgi:hypothetical protein